MITFLAQGIMQYCTKSDKFHFCIEAPKIVHMDDLSYIPKNTLKVFNQLYEPSRLQREWGEGVIPIYLQDLNMVPKCSTLDSLKTFQLLFKLLQLLATDG